MRGGRGHDLPTPHPQDPELWTEVMHGTHYPAPVPSSLPGVGVGGQTLNLVELACGATACGEHLVTNHLSQLWMPPVLMEGEPRD